MKGLVVLGGASESLEFHESLISRIRGALSAGTKIATSEAVKQVVAQVFTTATAYI